MKRIISILYNNPFSIFVLFLAVAYLPVFLPFFHLKNDLITQNLPTRYVISESLYSNFFLWWNPYIHFGIPQYGDMNNGYWNPFLWIIAKTVGYNIWTITLEEMLYILIGGWGMYKVGKEFFSKNTCIITGLSYMASGYIIGHLQHFCWITGTAFFPYVLLFFIRVHKNPIVKNFICGALASFFFLSATHPGLIIGAMYFFLFCILLLYFYRKKYTSVLYHRWFWPVNILFLLITLLFSSVILVSDFDVLQHISRGEKLSRPQMLLNPTSLQSYVSLAFPLVVHKGNFWETDISMRNVYIGLACFAGLFSFGKLYPRKVFYTIAPFILFFVLLSSGGYFKLLFSKIFPFVGYVRMNGEFTYFTILIFFLMAGAGIERILSSDNNLRDFTIYAKIFAWFFGISFITALIFLFFSGEIFGLSPLVQNASDSKEKIKAVVNNIPASWLFLIETVIQLCTIILIKKNIDKKNLIAAILIFNLILHSWLILPFTGLGMKSKKDFDTSVSIFEKGIHAPELNAIKNTKYLEPNMLAEVMLVSSYSKKIGYTTEETYPVQLKTSRDFFANPPLFQFIINQSYLFLSSDTTINSRTTSDSSRIHILEFAPGYLKATVNGEGYRYITFLQNNYPYWIVKINGEKVSHFTGFQTFITTGLPQKEAVIEFIFDPYPIRISLYISISLIGCGIILLTVKRWKRKTVFS